MGPWCWEQVIIRQWEIGPVALETILRGKRKMKIPTKNQASLTSKSSFSLPKKAKITLNTTSSQVFWLNAQAPAFHTKTLMSAVKWSWAKRDKKSTRCLKRWVLFYHKQDKNVILSVLRVACKTLQPTYNSK
jgi:hypothetical protein